MRAQQEESNPLYRLGKKMLPSSQTVTEQLRQQTPDSQFHGISSLKGEGGLCTELFLQLAPQEISVHRCSQHCFSNTRHVEASVWQLGGAGNCFMYRGCSCRVPWTCWLARVTGARLKVPETLSLKSYILISVSTTRAQSF